MTQSFCVITTIIVLIMISMKQSLLLMGKSPGAVANMLYCNIVVTKFKLQLCYYIHFQSGILGKGMNPLIYLAMV